MMHLMSGRLTRLLIFLTAVSGYAHSQESESIPRIPPYQSFLNDVLTSSLDGKRAALLESRSRADVDIAGYLVWPKLNGNATWTKQDPDAGRDQSYGATMTYPLYDFGRTSAQRDNLDLEAQIRALEVKEINEELSFEVASAYINYLSSLRVFLITSENMKISQGRLDVTRNDYRKGLRSENDLVTAEADFGDTQLAYERAKIELEIQAKRIFLLLPIETKTPTDAPSSWQLEALHNSAKNPAQWSALVKDWSDKTSDNLDMQVALQKDQLEARRKLLQSNAMPTLGLSLSAQNSGSWEDTSNTYTGQVQLSWDLTWPGLYRAEKEKLAVDQSLIETEFALEQQQREKAAQLALGRFEMEKNLWTSAQQQISRRKKQYDLTNARYRAGSASPLELSNAELEFGRAKLEQARVTNSLVQSILEYGIAKRVTDLRRLFESYAN